MVPRRRLPLALLFPAVLLAAPAALLAAAPVLGPQIQVNVSSQDFNTVPKVAVFPDGGFIVVWDVSARTGPGANRFAIHARSFAPDGSPASGEFLLAANAGVDAIAAAGNGRFVLAYNEGLLQVFSRAGKPLTAPVVVDIAAPQYFDYDFVIAVGGDGRIAVAWARGGMAFKPPGPCSTNSYARLYSPRLAPLTGTLGLGGGSELYCDGPQPDAIVLLHGDEIFALLTYYGDGTAVYAVWIDRYGDGLLVGGLGVDCTALDLCETYDASLAVGADGRMVVVQDNWPPPGHDGGAPGQSIGITGQAFDAQNESLTGTFQVQRHLVGTLTSPQVAWVGASQAFVVVWLAEAGQDGVGTDVFGRLLASDATPLGRDFRVSLPAAPGQDPPALAAGGANAVAAWAEESTSTVYARIITP